MLYTNCVCVLIQSHPTLCDSWAVAHQAPLSMETCRQEYWSRLPFPTPGNLPDPGIKPTSLALLHWHEDSLPLCHLEALYTNHTSVKLGKRRLIIQSQLHFFSLATNNIKCKKKMKTCKTVFTNL